MTDEYARRVATAMVVTDYWREHALKMTGVSSVGHTHALNCVLQALDGETDPTALGLDGPAAAAVRAIALDGADPPARVLLAQSEHAISAQRGLRSKGETRARIELAEHPDLTVLLLDEDAREHWRRGRIADGVSRELRDALSTLFATATCLAAGALVGIPDGTGPLAEPVPAKTVILRLTIEAEE